VLGLWAVDDRRVGSRTKNEHAFGVGVDEPVLGDAESAIVVCLSHEIELPGAGRQDLDDNRREPLNAAGSPGPEHCLIASVVGSEFCIFTDSASHLLVDLSGWYRP
jgi:hypothetical protein